MPGSDPDLLSLFREEADTRLSALSDLLLQLEGGDSSPEIIHAIFREAHTIKGSAAVSGLDQVAREAHVLEELLDRLRSGEWEVTPDVIDTILGSVDQLYVLITGSPAKGSSSVPSAPVASGEVLADADADADSGDDGDDDDSLDDDLADELEEDDDEPDVPEALRAAVEAAPLGVQSPARPIRAETARVAIDRLDDLVRVAGESTAAHLRLAQVLAERVGDDPAVTTEVRAMTRLLTELHEKTLRARMMPIGTISGQLRRAVRDLARAQGKQVRLDIRGDDTELDRGVHEAVADALVHLVRNAVDHGIEEPAARRAEGKPEDATIVIHAMQLGSRVIVTVSDDGRGLDEERIRGVASARSGMDASPLSTSQVHELIFEPGLSTATVVTEISGRGVGLDSVKSTIEALRGRIEVFSTPGLGSTFRLAVPITLAVVRALVVEAAGVRYALPMHAVSTVLAANTPELMVEGGPTVRYLNQVVPLNHLAHVLGFGQGERGPVVVMTGLTRTHAFRVDALSGQRELVVKGLPSLVPVGDIVVGGSAEPDGTVMLVLDADGIIEAAAGRGSSRLSAAAVPGVPTAVPTKARARARVIVVDDALTVRELQRSILERAGYEVRIAVDGIDALERLEDGFDLMLTDIEMPRMDGLTLTRAVRAKPQWANLPIVMLTTRSSPEDRQAGMEAGADAYIVKSAFNESALLGIVESLLGARQP